jgi:hypothetical protein
VRDTFFISFKIQKNILRNANFLSHLKSKKNILHNANIGVRDAIKCHATTLREFDRRRPLDSIPRQKPVSKNDDGV